MDQGKLREIMRNLETGDRTKTELRRCGCEECMEALRMTKTRKG